MNTTPQEKELLSRTEEQLSLVVQPSGNMLLNFQNQLSFEDNVKLITYGRERNRI